MRGAEPTDCVTITNNQPTCCCRYQTRTSTSQQDHQASVEVITVTDFTNESNQKCVFVHILPEWRLPTWRSCCIVSSEKIWTGIRFSVTRPCVVLVFVFGVEHLIFNIRPSLHPHTHTIHNLLMCFTFQHPLNSPPPNHWILLTLYNSCLFVQKVKSAAGVCSF